jgi:hypothetical protein
VINFLKGLFKKHVEQELKKPVPSCFIDGILVETHDGIYRIKGGLQMHLRPGDRLTIEMVIVVGDDGRPRSEPTMQELGRQIMCENNNVI